MRKYTDKNYNKNDLKKKRNAIEPLTLLRKPPDKSLTHGISKCGLLEKQTNKTHTPRHNILC